MATYAPVPPLRCEISIGWCYNLSTRRTRPALSRGPAGTRLLIYDATAFPCGRWKLCCMSSKGGGVPPIESTFLLSPRSWEIPDWFFNHLILSMGRTVNSPSLCLQADRSAFEETNPRFVGRNYFPGTQLFTKDAAFLSRGQMVENHPEVATS